MPLFTIKVPSSYDVPVLEIQESGEMQKTIGPARCGCANRSQTVGHMPKDKKKLQTLLIEKSISSFVRMEAFDQ